MIGAARETLGFDCVRICCVLCACVLCCAQVADLSYPSKGLDYSMQWIDRCLEEFFEQGDREKDLGLPVGYDRVTLDKPKSQVGFFTFFVQPMYETLDVLIPLPEQIEAVHTLTSYWKAQLAK